MINITSCQPPRSGMRRAWAQIWMIMRLTAILIIISTFTISAKSYSQKVSLSLENSSLENAFGQIREQTGYSFLWNERSLSGLPPISVSVHRVSIEDAVKACLKGLPVTYEIHGKIVYIKSKAIRPAPESIDTDTLPIHIVRGRVTDSIGRPLEGATVMIKGTNTGSQTDVQGEFQLQAIKPGDQLIVSYIGYQSRQFTVEDGTRYLSVVLKPSHNILDETVVQAYGTTTRRFNVGSISTINAATIEKQPVTNVLLALEGQAPGLAVTATSGVPGSQVLVQVRGQNTLMTGAGFGLKPYDQPLFIIDGVPFATQNANINQLNSLAQAQWYQGGISQSGGVSPFNNINPLDIESISILKDADATSIYGTQGSNGVILITTKREHSGKTDFNLSINTGFNSSINRVKLLNTQQFLQYRKDAFAADGIMPGSDPNDYMGYAPDLTIFDQNKYTDWQNVIFGKTSNNTNIHGSLSGGSNNNTFLVSVGYTRSTYNFPGNYADQRWSFHSAIHHHSFNNRFTIDLVTDYGYDQNNSPSYGSGDIILPPNTPDLLDSSGGLVWSYKGVDLSMYQFYAYLKKPTNLQNYNFNSSWRLSYKILKGLSFSASLGYNRNMTSEHAVNPAASQSPLYPYPSASFARNIAQTINIEPQIDYNISLGKGVFSVLLGASYKKTKGSTNTLYGYGYSNDDLMGSVNGATEVQAADGSSIYKYNAGFARLKYIYDQKYIIDLNGRRDGSSNFGPGRQFGNFGSVGAGWIFSEEKGFKEFLSFMGYGKLSGSYGTSGSDGGSSYKYQAFWQPNGYLPPFQGIQPSFPQNFYNPDYSWALKRSLNIALDLGFFSDRILLNATYYRNREGNQLSEYPLPIHTGFSSVLKNLKATVQNKGWEFLLNSTNVKSESFSWTSNFNISFNRNKLLSFPNLASSSYSNQYIIGQPTSVILGYKYKGVNPTTGLYEFYTKDGKVTSNPAYGLASNGGDYVPIGNREVNYMGGVGNNLSYRHFSLYFFFQFSSQTAPTWLYGLHGGGVSFPQNVPTAVLNNYWKSPGDHALLQRLSGGYNEDVSMALNNFLTSSGVYANDTYVRMKTVSLSYSLPVAFIKKMHMKGCKIYMNIQNVFTITNYKVGDPEQFADYTAFPLQRIVTFGLNFNF